LLGGGQRDTAQSDRQATDHRRVPADQQIRKEGCYADHY
jgi:hypothetical protein